MKTVSWKNKWGFTRTIHLSLKWPFFKFCRGTCICDVVAILDSIK